MEWSEAKGGSSEKREKVKAAGTHNFSHDYTGAGVPIPA